MLLGVMFPPCSPVCWPASDSFWMALVSVSCTLFPLARGMDPPPGNPPVTGAAPLPTGGLGVPAAVGATRVVVVAVRVAVVRQLPGCLAQPGILPVVLRVVSYMMLP